MTIGPFIRLAGCNDPDEKKTRCITVYLSPDVDIKEAPADLDTNKPPIIFACS